MYHHAGSGTDKLNVLDQQRGTTDHAVQCRYRFAVI